MKTLKSVTLFLSIVVIFVLAFLTPTMVIPASDDVLKMMDADQMELFFPLLVLFALYTSITYWLVIKNTDVNKIRLFWKLLLALFIIYPLMGLLESLFWGEAFKGIETSEFLKVFFRFVITFTLFSAYLSIISKKTQANVNCIETRENYKLIGKKILLIAAIYFVVYNLFGYFVAWQFEATRIFYTGNNELEGFLPAMFKNISDPKFVVVHLFRGTLFGIAGYVFHTILRGSKWKLIVIMALIFGGFGFQIILPNPFFPEIVRISHFLETTLSMLLFGALVGYVLNDK